MRPKLVKVVLFLFIFGLFFVNSRAALAGLSADHCGSPPGTSARSRMMPSAATMQDPGVTRGAKASSSRRTCCFEWSESRSTMTRSAGAIMLVQRPGTLLAFYAVLESRASTAGASEAESLNRAAIRVALRAGLAQSERVQTLRSLVLGPVVPSPCLEVNRPRRRTLPDRRSRGQALSRAAPGAVFSLAYRHCRHAPRIRA